MALDEAFGHRIRRRRLELGFTQREVAERVARRLKESNRRGFDVTYLSKIENERLPPPSAPAILALATELADDADELLALAGKAPPDVGEALKRSKAARTFFRSATDMSLSEDEWKRLLDTIKEKKT